MAKRRRKRRNPYKSFYDRPVHQRLGVKIIDGLMSAGAVYLLSPYLLRVLAPVQASINSTASAAGQPVSNVGSATVANQLILAAKGLL